MRILNLYAGIGGNRKLWGDEHEITAVEYDEATAEVYKSYFPNDTVLIEDAHEYLLNYYKKFDFIWGSPPCPTHSRINFACTRKPDYPDMRLYQEIIFLYKWCKDKLFVVENVIPYYKPLIPPQIIDRHCFWSNFTITEFEPTVKAVIRMQGGQVPFENILGFDLSGSRIRDKKKALRNCVHPETGLHILNCAMGVKTRNQKQDVLFEELL